jgi:hypothetical protein
MRNAYVVATLAGFALRIGPTKASDTGFGSRHMGLGIGFLSDYSQPVA